MYQMSEQLSQPFESFEDAERFLSFYDSDSSVEEHRAYLRARLVPNNDSRFPLLLPNTKHFIIFEIDVT